MAHGAKAELNIEKNGKRVAVVGSGPAGPSAGSICRLYGKYPADAVIYRNDLLR